jgi:hypothetical protein
MLAEVQTEGDRMAICTCLHGEYSRVELMRLFVRGMRRKCRLSDVYGEGRVWGTRSDGVGVEPPAVSAGVCNRLGRFLILS